MARTDLVTSGDAEIDALRLNLHAQVQPTDAKNFPYRLALLTSWLHLLQRQGADLSGYAPHFDALKRSAQQADDAALFTALAAGFAYLDRVQRALRSAAPDIHTLTSTPESADEYALTDWPLYGGNMQHTASTEAPGPTRGEIAWRQPIGLAWYARPTVDDGRVYAAVPGIRCILRCLDLASGEELWSTRRVWTRSSLGVVNLAPSSYVVAGAASTPLVLEDRVIVNELGAQGRAFGARHLLVIDKATGELGQRFPAGQADYRAGFAPLAGNAAVAVYPTGTQRIKDRPPQVIAANRIVCQDIHTGEILWDFHVGTIFCEPLVDANHAFVGTADGQFFCLNLSGASGADHFGFSDERRVAWHFRARGPVNASAEVSENRVVFGDNAGWLYCLDRVTGAVLWETQGTETEDRSLRLYSRPAVANDRVYVGTAAGQLRCFDVNTGRLHWSFAATDWIRARPYVDGQRVIFAQMDGQVCCLEDRGDHAAVAWQERVGTHPVYADLVCADGRLLVSAANLTLWCLDATSGAISWSQPLLDHARIEDRVFAADELACGGWYQSKPTAADGKVFVGTPSHFVCAYHHETGTELWRFEVGGAVSGAPAYADGKIFIGQQGGEEYFYCLDAHTGRPLWRQNLGWVWASANVAAGRVYVAGVDGYVSALDAATGHIIWRYRTGSSTAPEPPVDAGRVFFGSWDHYVYAFAADSGALLWQFHTGGSPDSGAPIAHGGRLYVPMGGKRLCCIDAASGHVIWEYRLTEGDMNASPALWRDRLFISTSLRPGAIPIASNIQCLDINTGKLIWEHRGGGITGPSVAAGKVYFASTADPFFSCVDATGNGDGTTSTLWRCELGERVYESVPALYGGRAFILSESGYLYALA